MRLSTIKHHIETLEGVSIVPTTEMQGVYNGYHREIGQLVVAGEQNPRRLGVISQLACELLLPFAAVYDDETRRLASEASLTLEGSRLVLVSADFHNSRPGNPVAELNRLPNILGLIKFEME